MKVLTIHNSYQQPGGEDVVFAQERQLLESRGHQVLAYQRSNNEIKQLSALQRLALVKRITSAEDSKRDVRALLLAHKPDLVHVHSTFVMISPSIYEECWEAQVPVVQTLQNYRLICPGGPLFRDGHVCEECISHGLFRGVWHGCYRESRTSTAAVALMLKIHRERRTWSEMVSGYVVATEFARKKFIEGGLPAEKLYVKPNFVEADSGERNGAGDYALFAGRLSQEKGVLSLLQGWNQLATPVPLMIIGDGPLRSQLEAEAVKKKLRQVTFRGRLNRSDTRDAMKHAAFLILPSLCYEGFPMVLAESFACGTPVLGSRLGAIQEIVADGRTGLHFTPGDPLDLAEKVYWAWNHPTELAVMGREARQEFETRYTPDVNYSRLMAIYQQVLSATPRTGIRNEHDDAA